MTYTDMAAINVNDKTEKRNGFTYLSWAWAWDQFKRAYPDARYEVKRGDDGLPYVYDPLTGYMVFTEVEADGIKYEMWLPVMDSANNAMKAEPYTKHGRYKDMEVPAATMFDVNKAIMRCLVKNLAMFGLGLYIYAGEDLPDVLKEPSEKETAALNKANADFAKTYSFDRNYAIAEIRSITQEDDIKKACQFYKAKSLADMTDEQIKTTLASARKRAKDAN